MLLVAAPAPARAGGFTTARFGGEHGNVTDDHPTAIYYNPARLALGHGWRIYAEGVIAWRMVEHDRPSGAINNVLDPGEDGSGTPSDAVDANSGKATLSNLIVSPFLGVATDLGVPNLGLG